MPGQEHPLTPYQRVSRELAARPRRWLVTGAAGFIGSALVERLLELDQTVIGLDNFATGHRRNLEDVLGGVAAGQRTRFRLLEGNIADGGVCRQACRGIDYLLHQAAIGSVPRSLKAPLESHHANVDGFLELLWAAREAGVTRIVYASSSAVYGDHPDLPKVEEQIGRPLSPYAATKHIDEIYAGIFQDCYGLELIGLRYFNIFGRRQDPHGPYAAVIPRWIGHLLRGEPCAIFGDGSQSRDFCYIDNAVQANLLAATCARAATGEVYNVGCGERTSLIELFALLRDGVAEFRPEAKHAAFRLEAPRRGDIPHSQASIAKLSDRLGYRPSHTIGEGLRQTVAWFATAGQSGSGKHKGMILSPRQN